MLTLFALLAMACTPTDPPGDSSPIEETAPPRDTQDSEPPDDTDPPTPLPAVVVNELMADNEGAHQADDGSFPDWLELYNADQNAVDLSGYSISDDWTEKAQAVLPQGTTMEPGAYLLLYADDSDQPGHLPFKLSAQGEGVGVFAPDGEALDWITFPPLVEDHSYARLPDGEQSWEQVARGTPGASNLRQTVQTTALVERGATWRYLDSGEYPGDAWVQAEFDDASWASGPAPLGYGDSQTTELSYGDDASNKHITTWFRHPFDLPADTLASASEASLGLRVDDGAVVWLNGAELLRQGMGDGEIGPDSYATDTASGDNETNYTSYDFELGLLVEGANQLAVEVHQNGGTSSDLTLDLELSVEGWVEVE